MKRVTLILAILLALLIAMANMGALVPVARALSFVPAIDKVSHFVLYGLLGFCVAITWRREPRTRSIVNALCLTIITVEEFSQHWMAYRTFDGIDLAMSYAGFLLFGLLAKQLRRLQRSIRLYAWIVGMR